MIDDGSTDGTSGAAAAAGARVLRHPYRMGNGAAVKTGIREASGGTLVMIDGDGQHDPAEIPLLLKELERCDMAVGARNGGQSFLRRGANRFYNRLASYLTGVPIEDLTSGFRCISKDLMQQFISILPNGFSYTTTSTLALIHTGRTVAYVPISSRARLGKSKVNMCMDGIKFFLIILKISGLCSPLKMVLPVGVLLFVLGLVNYAITFVTERRFTNMSVLLFAGSLIVTAAGFLGELVAQVRYLQIGKDGGKR